jgi:putative acetyltransferase
VIEIRPETPADFAAVREVNELAFEQPAEAGLVHALRAVARPLISLVAVEDGRVVGHILFSPVTIEGPDGVSTAMGLAPVAVRAECQNRGIGSALVREGRAACAALGENVVVVLDHPHYYPRFGFVPAATKGLSCEYPVPDDVFMVTELVPGALRGRTGLVRYHAEFARV